MRHVLKSLQQLAVAVLLLGVVTAATNSYAAEQIDISNYGVTVNGIPFGIALAKGFFKEAGVDISGIISDSGGGTTIRNVLSGDLLYGEPSLAGAVLAIQQGADIKIISGNVHTVAEFFWVTMPNSGINSLQDFKGKRLGFTNPQSTTQALGFLLAEIAGLKQDDIKMVRTGGFGPGLTALESNGIDIMPVAEPLWSKNMDKYKMILRATDFLPPLNNVVGVTTGKAAKTKPQQLRALLVARRRAVEFLYKNPKESAEIVAKEYRLPVAVAENVIRNLTTTTTKGVPYWGPGDFHIESMNNMIRAQRLVGVIKGEVDWSKMIDESFLPDDLKSKKRN